MKYRNPVIPGFYPDPSVCAANGKYYLVCSSFQYFPGVPLFESSDLLNWTQIGHVLTRASQLPLQNANTTGGIYAPTIRYSGGRFYMVTTNVTNGGHFYVYTDDIYGEWSEPVWVDQEGIDPSLFFEDGRVYFMSNGSDSSGRSAILQCEIDPATGKRLTETRAVWGGAGGRFLESPHLYHIGAYYYLMASEGGTEYGHMVVLARGKTPYGPFEACPQNPVLTNRNLGGYLLQGCGHGDLVQDGSGNWWMLHLGFRQIHPWMMFHTTGREVCLVPVTFGADGWMTAGEGGVTRLEMMTDRIPPETVQRRIPALTAENTAPGREWVFMQNPDPACYRFDADGWALRGKAVSLSDETASPTWLGIRQQETAFTFSAELTPSRQESGITAYMTGTMHLDLLVRPGDAGGLMLMRRVVLGSLVHEDHLLTLPEGCTALTLRLTGTPCDYRGSAVIGGTEYDLGLLESKYLSTELAGNFTGVMLAFFAVNTQNPGDAETVFHSFGVEYPEQG